MLRLTDPQRAVLVQTFPAIAHVAAGALVFGQFLRDRPFLIRLALTGISLWVVCVTVAVVLAGGGRWTNR